MKILMTIFTIFYSTYSLSYVDLSLSYSQSIRKVDGIESDTNLDSGEAITTSKGYSINWAWYIWETVALELNYGSSSERIVDDRSVTNTDDDGAVTTINKLDSTIETETIGVGLRIALAGRKARIVPTISIGYAKYTTAGRAIYDITIDGTNFEFEQEEDEETFNSSYASASLRFRITKFLGLTVGAKTVMPDFETSEAANNITYQAGLSWVF